MFVKTRPRTRLRPRLRTIAAGGRAIARGALALLLVVGASWGVFFAAVPVPAGDPVLLASAPADGADVSSPDELRLIFDRPVPAGLATVRMTNPLGAQVVSGRPYNPPGAADTVAVAMPATRYGGTYSVAWVLPSSRLEPIGTTSTFHVSAPSTTPTAGPAVPVERDPVVTVVHSVARLAATAAFALGIGVALLLVSVWPAGTRNRTARRVIGFAWCATVLATAATFLTFGAYAARTTLAESFDPALVSAAAGSGIGTGLVARLLVLVAVTFALGLLMTGPPADSTGRRWLRAGSVLAGSAALAATWTFSRPQDPLGPGLLTLGTDVALLLALAAAVGGPVVLWLAVRSAGDAQLRIVVPRLAVVLPVSGALLLVLAVIATDGWQLVALLLLGVAVIATGVAGGWWVRRRHRTGGNDLPGRRRLHRLTAVAVATVAVALLAATASTGTQLALSERPAGGTGQVHGPLPDAR